MEQAPGPDLSSTGMTKRQPGRWGTGSPGDVTEATSCLVSKCKPFNVHTYLGGALLLATYHKKKPQKTTQNKTNKTTKKPRWTLRNWIKQGIKYHWLQQCSANSNHWYDCLPDSFWLLLWASTDSVKHTNEVQKTSDLHILCCLPSLAAYKGH